MLVQVPFYNDLKSIMHTYDTAENAGVAQHVLQNNSSIDNYSLRLII